MSTIKLQNLSLLNFKGIRKLNIDFEENTSIYGANGTGKTTVFDAFTWLLFGKDSSGNTQFEIKTLDENNNAIPQIDHEVSATLLINDEPAEIKRIYREKWVKKRGSLEAEFSGHETIYFWNEVPISAKEFTSKISEIIDENLFKLITNPLVFNALKWQEQRQVLIDISGGVTDNEVAGTDADLQDLLNQLNNKTLEEYKKQITAQRRKANDEIKLIPSRIDEVERSKPEPVDAVKLNKTLNSLECGLAEIENQIQNEARAHQASLDKQKEIQTQLHDRKMQMQEAKLEAKSYARLKAKELSGTSDALKNELQKANEQLLEYQDGVKTLKKKLDAKNVEISTIETQLKNLRAEWKKLNASEITFNEEDFHCPTCKRAFETGDIDEKKQSMIDNFNADKTKALKENNRKGKSAKELQTSLEQETQNLEERILKGEKAIEEATTKVKDLEAKLNEEKNNAVPIDENEIVQQILDESEWYANIADEVEALEAKLNNFEDFHADEDLLNHKKQINAQIKEVETELSNEKLIEKADARISELQEEQRQLAQIIADKEKIEYDIERFSKLKIDKLESVINNKFSFVKFKMFETQINGSEIETCKALINGVPFSDANTASKINAGIDIINALCEHYGVHAPIFIDNRESVTELIPTQSQVINLIVSPEDKKLRISNQ